MHELDNKNPYTGEKLVNMELEWNNHCYTSGHNDYGTLYVVGREPLATPILFVPVTITDARDGTIKRRIQMPVVVPEGTQKTHSGHMPLVRVRWYTNEEGLHTELEEVVLSTNHRAMITCMEGCMNINGLRSEMNHIAVSSIWGTKAEFNVCKPSSLEPTTFDSTFTIIRLNDNTKMDVSERRERRIPTVGITRVCEVRQSSFLINHCGTMKWSAMSKGNGRPLENFRKTIADPRSTINIDTDEIFEGPFAIGHHLVKKGLMSRHELTGLPVDWTEEHW
ncbi:hypothetical protein GR11A_00180 [Vibrio phage vB_VcorM_GR11A]|nr:hypothetical protein GR11A_00180 [Vibrio phage vB_VcorM_GR11A]